MPRPKGTPKTGGRKRGTPNKATIPVAELCDAKGCNPIEALIEFCVSSNPGFRFQAAKELSQYIHPKRKAIEHSGEIKNAVSELSDAEIDRRLQRLLRKEEKNGEGLDSGSDKA